MDDNSFECPNCGAVIYPEVRRCPQCGRDMYPEDDESGTSDTEEGPSGWSSLVGAALIGCIIAGGLAFIIHFVAAQLVAPGDLGTIAKLTLAAAGPVGALVGGYVSAGLAKQHAKLTGVVVGAMALPVLLLMSTRWVQVTLPVLLNPWMLGSGLLTLVGGLSGGWLNENLVQDPSWREKWKVRGWEDLLYQDLLRKVRFNGSIADRLIDYERKQDPQASRLTLIQSAIQRWERDNR
jgi:hypothetical protein